MLESVLEPLNSLKINFTFDNILFLISIVLAIAITVIASFFLPGLIKNLVREFFSLQQQEAYQKVIAPYQGSLAIVIILAIIDIFILAAPTPNWLEILEIPLSLAVSGAVSWVGFRIFRQFFDIYLLDAALKSKEQFNSELLIIAKVTANIAIVLVVIVLFAQTHNVNIFGLIASLGVGGLAVAFAAQKTLEQLLGGIVIYIDRPFVVNDYIGLPDGTFGSVESIGLRSTKIRTSGKGTLMVVPNSSLTAVNIENFTGAKKVISILYLNFHTPIPDKERAFVRQIILDSTNDIFGIDPRSTEVVFKDAYEGKKDKTTQAQINFFILGSGKVSMELRSQLLELARQSISEQLQEYGLTFEIEEKNINVASPITI